MFFTTHDRPVTIGADIYSPTQAPTVGAIERTGGLDPNNTQITGVQGAITADMTLNGSLEGVEVITLKGVDWRNPPADIDSHPSAFTLVGIIGEVMVEGQTTWVIQQQSKIERRLNQSPLLVTSPLCSRQFCDAGCTLDPAPRTVATTIASVASQTQFTLVGSSLIDFSFGTLTFDDGPNAGQTFGVSTGSGGVINLAEVPEGLVEAGQAVTAFAGCNKTVEDCTNRHGNFVNFLGIPAGGGWMPGADKYINPPITH